MKIWVEIEDLEEVISWWRHCNEAPGGCSFQESIKGMANAVRNLEMQRREQGGKPL